MRLKRRISNSHPETRTSRSTKASKRYRRQSLNAAIILIGVAATKRHTVNYCTYQSYLLLFTARENKFTSVLQADIPIGVVLIEAVSLPSARPQTT